MSKFLSAINGYKTYGVVVLMILYCLIGLYLGKGFDTTLFLQALALAGIRNAIK